MRACRLPAARRVQGLVDNRFYKSAVAALRAMRRASRSRAGAALLGFVPTLPSHRRSAARRRLRVLAAALAGAGVLAHAAEPEDAIRLQPSTVLTPPPRGKAGEALPIILQARTLRGRPDLDAVAEGDAELRRGGVVVRADRLSYDQGEDLARATGNVRITKDGNVYTGPEAELRLQRFEGLFKSPTYYFALTGAGGKAQSLEFLDEQRAVATEATYTSCGIDGSGAPAWVLSAQTVRIDTEINEGVAKDAVLRFYGVPILAAPSLSFPLSDARKSGWLPPSLAIDSKSGVQLAVPYYWNIAPDRDATLTPAVSARRGASLDTEIRYLEPNHRGEDNWNYLPYDGLAHRPRFSLVMQNESAFGPYGLAQLHVDRVSDDDYWKDFPGAIASLTPRLLGSDLRYTRRFGAWTTYGRAEAWQVLQTTDPTTRIVAPYQRMPQVGARTVQTFGPGLEVGFEGEFNRFIVPDNDADGPRPNGQRVHALGSISRPWTTPGWSFVPKFSFNAASYALDEPQQNVRTNASRLIPTLSVDSAWTLERDAHLFGRAVRQTLEPRLLYVNTPFVRQDDLPNFDAAGKDFNYESIFSDNQFSGVDRVSDQHSLTAGVTTRLLDPSAGTESMLLGVAQRYLFRRQQVTPALVSTSQHFSDLLLFGSTSLVRDWNLDAQLQYSPDSSRVQRSVSTVRWSPGPFRTITGTYRLTRGLTEQTELGWQWPLYGPPPPTSGPRTLRTSGSGACGGSLYTVGRMNYSLRDRRLIDSIVGFEYDAGCWIARVVAERLSTGHSDATTRLLVQLELVGLSRLGTNPLQVLKDNIPGYRVLRDERIAAPPYDPHD
jgi:LPS-assembly protein